MSLQEWAEAFLRPKQNEARRLGTKAPGLVERARDKSGRYVRVGGDGENDEPAEEKAIALLSLNDAFQLLNRVTDREYRAWEKARGRRKDKPKESEVLRSGWLLAKYLETFARLVGLAREGYFDAREFGAEQQPVRVPDFEGVEDEAKRKELLDRYKKVLEEEERLIQETAALAP